ncbi:hypothetical protein HWV62_13116 [Athelia sp. TMB]|nr:hypothetical protein HWV62_13116 [Athelia sp. TMB]
MQNENDDIAKAVKQASAALSTTEATSKHEKLNKIEDRLTEPANSGYYSTGSDFYAQNSDAIKSAANAVAQGIDLGAIEDDIRGFAESSRVLMSLLDEVAKVHPVVGVAVLAFKAVVTLELKRRDNDKKVVALHLQMQDMMSTLLQLRDIKRYHKGTDGRSVQDRLDDLMRNIAKDITNCGNICDTYSKKRLLVKILKGPIYEGRLSDCASAFMGRKKEIRMALAIHTALKLDSVMTAVTDVDEKVNSASEAVDTIILFRLLDSSEEKELLQRVKDKGGAKACMEDDSILLELSKLRQELRDRRTRKECSPRAADGAGPGYMRARRSTNGDRFDTGPVFVEPGSGYYRRVRKRTSDPSIQAMPDYYSKPVAISQPPQNSHYTPYYPQPSGIIPIFTPYPHTTPGPISPQYAVGSGYTTVPGATQVYAGKVDDETPYAVGSGYTTAPGATRFYPGQAWDATTDQQLTVLYPLKAELKEDVSRSLEKNMVVFKRQLDVQTRELESIVIREGDRVIAAVTAGAHERVLDSDLRTIWKEMDWKRSVNSREFVFALHEYFTEKYSRSDPLRAYITSVAPKSSEEFRVAKRLANKKANNMRTLEYINMRHIQPILEAFDDDGSGYVSIREVNQLSTARPSDWSLPQWVSYWAVGWHYNIWNYKLKICGIIHSIYQERENLLPSNRALVDYYLADPALDDLLTMLWYIQPFDADIDDQFRQRAIAYAQQEESRMEGNMRLMAYEVDDTSTLSLITGPGRVERHLLPVLFLAMRHHLRVIRLASHVILDKDELRAAAKTIKQVLAALQDRATDLEAIFDQQNTFGPSNHGQFDKFAFGMFLHLGEPRVRDIAIDDPGLSGSYQDAATVDATFLKYPGISGPDTAAYSVAELTAVPSFNASQNIGGIWSGLCSSNTTTTASTDTATSTCGLMEISLAVDATNSKLTGNGVDAEGPFEISGKYQMDGTIQLVLTRTGSVASTVVHSRHFTVKKDATSRALVGNWSIDADISLGSLILEPVPLTH